MGFVNVNVNVNNLLAIQKLNFDNSGERGPQAVLLHVELFLHSVASPFHSFVTFGRSTSRSCGSTVAATKRVPHSFVVSLAMVGHYFQLMHLQLNSARWRLLRPSRT